jgi:hypothetical protein
MSAVPILVTIGVTVSFIAFIAWLIVRTAGHNHGGQSSVREQKADPKQLAREIAYAEAELGIPLATDPGQPCPVCQTPRVVGARYCAACRYDWEPIQPKPHVLLCPECDKRIPDDSHVCPFCGTTIQESLRHWNQYETTVPWPVAVSKWCCQLCGTTFTCAAPERPEARPSRCDTCGASFDWRPVPAANPPAKPAAGTTPSAQRRPRSARRSAAAPNKPWRRRSSRPVATTSGA